MSQERSTPIDERLLTHHPAGKACLDVCMANGWLPENGDVVRLVHLWQEVKAGHRSEEGIAEARLRFARWLRDTGRISESWSGVGEAAA